MLGWGGYWAWDPVENASFLPWLTATAYLHSVMAQERRGMLRVWNLSLLVATFSLTILGTFLTRSGVLDSVHAFSESAIGPLILGFFALTTITSIGLIAWRGDKLRSPGSIDSPLSRGRGRFSPTTCCSPGSPSSCCWGRCSRWWPRRSGATGCRWEPPTSTA